MVEALLGSWQLVESHNFEDYLKVRTTHKCIMMFKEMGVGLMTRKAAAQVKPSVQLSRNGSVWTYDMRSTFKKNKFDFEIDKEFERETADGGKVKSTTCIEDGKLVQYQRATSDKGKDSKMTYSIDERGRLVIQIDCGSVRCFRIFDRVDQ